jgi:hypothetical protein
VNGLWAARDANRNHRFMLTKLPSDIEQIPAIRQHYATHPGEPVFVLMIRDPRDVLTSKHKVYSASQGLLRFA